MELVSKIPFYPVMQRKRRSRARRERSKYREKCLLTILSG